MFPHMLGLWVSKRMVGHVALDHCIFLDEVVGHQGSLEDIDVTLAPLPKGFIEEALHIINAECSI